MDTPIINQRSETVVSLTKILEFDTTPNWLSAIVPDFIYFLKGNIKVEAEQSTRTELIGRIDKLAEAIGVVIEELNDWKEMVPFLLLHVPPDNAAMKYVHQENFLPNENQMRHGLVALSQICGTAQVALPRKQGQGKLPSHGIPEGKELCAIMAMLIVEQAGKSQNGAYTPHVQEICEALWTASGGSLKHWGGNSDPNKGWIPYLKKAQENVGWQKRKLRELIEESLTEKK